MLPVWLYFSYCAQSRGILYPALFPVVQSRVLLCILLWNVLEWYSTLDTFSVNLHSIFGQICKFKNDTPICLTCTSILLILAFTTMVRTYGPSTCDDLQVAHHFAGSLSLLVDIHRSGWSARRSGMTLDFHEKNFYDWTDNTEKVTGVRLLPLEVKAADLLEISNSRGWYLAWMKCVS